MLEIGSTLHPQGMTTSPQATGVPPSSAQLGGEACIICGADEQPLHPAGILTVDGDIPGVVHDHDVMRCTGCLTAPRYQAAQLPADERNRVMWGIRDMARGGVWVETGGETERYTMEDGAKGWIARRKYLDETMTFGS